MKLKLLELIGEVLSKVVALIESFLMVCGTSPTRKEIEMIFDF